MVVAASGMNAMAKYTQMLRWVNDFCPSGRGWGYKCRRWLRRRILGVVQTRLVSEATRVHFTSKTGDTIVQKAYDRRRVL